MTESEKEWLKHFLDTPDIRYVTPDRKDYCYDRKVDGKSQHGQKQYLMWTLNDLLNIAKLLKTNLHLNFHLIKKKKSSIVCIQQRYSTVVLYLQNMLKYLFRCKSFELKIKSCNMVPTDPHSLAEKYNCDSPVKSCMFSEKECCYFTGVTMEEFPDDCDDVEYYAWAKVDGKVKKVVDSVGVEEAIKLVNYNLKTNKIYNSCPLQRKLQR